MTISSRRAGRLVCPACASYGRSVPHYELLAAQERLPGRPFTDPGRTLADARVMGRMLHWLVVPSTPALRDAQDVTVVGFFGDLRGGMDHSAVYDLEADVVARLGRYAPAGLLSYYDAEIACGLHGNLVLFGTPEVPCEWHGDIVHARAVALAPSHYRCLRLHRGIIRGALLGHGHLVIKRTRYFDFGRQPAWRGLRRFE